MSDPRTRHFWSAAVCVGALGTTVSCAEGPAAAPSWPDTLAARTEALALLQTLNSELLSNDSATATLTRWCELHKLSTAPNILAVQVRGGPKVPTDTQRAVLRVSATEPVRYRHVRLVCGTRVLSEAENWYVPSRLTPEMNHLLETTDTPFGAVVHELHFQRHTLSARLLWMPLPAGWEMDTAPAAPPSANLVVPDEVLEHRAVLSLPDGTPVSEVLETYTGNVLAFPPPRLAAHEP